MMGLVTEVACPVDLGFRIEPRSNLGVSSDELPTVTGAVSDTVSLGEALVSSSLGQGTGARESTRRNRSEPVGMLPRRTVFRPGLNIVTVVLCLASGLGAWMGAPGFGADGAKLTRSGKSELQKALLMGSSRIFW